MKTTLKISKKNYTEEEIIPIITRFMELVGNSIRDTNWHVELSSCNKYFILKFNFKEDEDEYNEHEKE